MVSEFIHVDSPNVSYSGDQITVNYEYLSTSVKKIENRLVVSVLVLLDLLLFLCLFRGITHLSIDFENQYHHFRAFVRVFHDSIKIKVCVCVFFFGLRLHRKMYP